MKVFVSHRFVLLVREEFWKRGSKKLCSRNIRGSLLLSLGDAKALIELLRGAEIIAWTSQKPDGSAGVYIWTENAIRIADRR